MGQVRTLIDFRLRVFRHRLSETGTPTRLALTILGIGILVGAGFALSPDEFGPVDVGNGVVHWGGWPLEAAFYLGCLVSLVQSFRILEAFFRHSDARFLATYPIRLRSLFIYRLSSALLGTGALAAACALFLLPVGIKGSWPHFFWSCVLLVAAVLLVVSIGFAAQMAAGVANYKHMPGYFSDLDRRSGGPSGGSAAYILSPAIAMACSLLLLLIGKLSLDELFKSQAQTGEFALTGIGRAAGVMLAIVTVGCLIWAYRNFTRHFPLLFARFFEADLVVPDVGYDYFARDRRPPRGLEARLPADIRTFYRLDRLQLARRRPLARLFAIAGPAGDLIVFSVFGDRLEPWLVVGVGLAWLLLFSNPFSRLFHPAMDPGLGRLLPVSPTIRLRARYVLLVREVLILGLPIGLAGLLLNEPAQVSAALVVTPAALAAIPLLSAIASRSVQAPRAVGALLAVAFAGLTRLGAWGPWGGVALVCALSFLTIVYLSPDPVEST